MAIEAIGLSTAETQRANSSPVFLGSGLEARSSVGCL